MAYRITVFANDRNLAKIAAGLEANGIDYARNSDGEIFRGDTAVGLPDFYQSLLYSEQHSRKIAIIDEASYSNRKAIFEGVGKFATDTANRMKGADTRIIYVFPEGYTAADLAKDINTLYDWGYYDVIVPESVFDEKGTADTAAAKSEAICAAIAELVKTKTTQREIIALRKPGMSTPAAAPAPVEKAPQVALNLDTRSRLTVSVASTCARGGATTLSMLLAGMLTLVADNVALVTDRETARALYSFMPGKSVRKNESLPQNFMYKGVRVYHDIPHTDVANGTRFVVMDLGVVGSEKDQKAKAREDGALEMSLARIMALPFGTPKDYAAARARFSASWNDIERWAIGIWGADESHFNALREQLAERAPDAVVFRIPNVEGAFSTPQACVPLAELARDLRIISPAECDKIASIARERAAEAKPAEDAEATPAEDAEAPKARRRVLFSRKVRSDA